MRCTFARFRSSRLHQSRGPVSLLQGKQSPEGPFLPGYLSDELGELRSALGSVQSQISVTPFGFRIRLSRFPSAKRLFR